MFAREYRGACLRKDVFVEVDALVLAQVLVEGAP